MGSLRDALAHLGGPGRAAPLTAWRILGGSPQCTKPAASGYHRRMSPTKPPRRRAGTGPASTPRAKPAAVPAPRPKPATTQTVRAKSPPVAPTPVVPAGEQWDLLVRDVRVVRPGKAGAALADIAVRGGKIIRMSRGLPADQAKRVHDGQGLLAFPGLVDANVHLGVYATLEEDAASESRAMAQGGITTALC